MQFDTVYEASADSGTERLAVSKVLSSGKIDRTLRN